MGSILKTDLFDFVSSIIPSMEELNERPRSGGLVVNGRD